MSWTAPATVVSGTLLTASWGNTYVRDNTLHLYDNQWRIKGLATESLVANVNNWNPASLATAMFLRIESSGAGRDITGIVPPSTDAVLILTFFGSFVTTIRNNSGSSSVGNKIILTTGADTGAGSGDIMFMFYDSVATAWKAALIN